MGSEQSRVLHLYESNRMERLADALGDVVAQAPGGPLSPECILVPGRGVSQWLSLRLSQRFGVWANALYLYPKNFMGWALGRVLGAPGQAVSSFEQDQLVWSVFKALRPLLDEPHFETLRHYVAGDTSQLRYFELCRRIASTFDRYATFRPDLVRAWERQPTAAETDDPPQLAMFQRSDPSRQWQRALWRALTDRLGAVHGAALERRFLSRLSRGRTLDNLPARICCLGVTSLPPSYTRILVALCPHVPVHMFQMRAGKSNGAPTTSVGVTAKLHESRPNPLLASTDALASEFDAVLADEVERQDVCIQRHALHEEPSATTRLSQLQRELSLGLPPAAWPPATDKPKTERCDDSIRVHVCHSPMREVEVVHDQLMALLAHNSGLEPRDVVVMMPDVERHAPLIEAVFRRGRDEGQRIPYCIADRSVHASAPVVDALARLMGLVDQRLNASQILDLLALEVLAARFDIFPEHLEAITAMIRAANIRWGIDSAHKAHHGHPPSDANTWREGLRRLALGYAVDTGEPALVLGALPALGMEGSQAQLLGRLAAFIETLFAQLQALSKPQTPAEWQLSIAVTLDALFVNDSETAWQHQQIRDALSTLVTRSQASEFDDAITTPALCEILFECIDSAHPARGFMAGGVTFCSMVPLRSIPFKVVCMLGMSDGQFPRREQRPDFDLIASDPEGPRLGDRSRRTDDRYLFLEALLSARERLIVTYTGQSIRDNSSLPASVLVGELLDYLAADAADDQQRAERLRPLIVRHPLQAFSHRYFDGRDPRLFSYEPCHPVVAGPSRSEARAHFFTGPLSAPSDQSTWDIEQLTRFFENPTAHLLNQRLGVSLREREPNVPDREPQELEPLDQYAVGQLYLELMLGGRGGHESEALLEATRLVPQGSPGTLALASIVATAAPIVERARHSMGAGTAAPLIIDAVLPSGRRLTGRLTGLCSEGLLQAQFSRVRGKHLVGLWVRHLLLCWQSHITPRKTSLLLGRALTGSAMASARLSQVSNAGQHLDNLLDIYQAGQQRPLMLFPDASLAYATALKKKPDRHSEARAIARKRWKKEVEYEPHVARLYEDSSPSADLFEVRGTSEPSDTAETFERLAERVMGPLLDHLEDDAT